jgi:ABC-type transporter Mla MlaB component
MANDHAVFDDGVLRITCTDNQDALALAGEIDESNYQGLVEVLAQIADEPGDLHFDLAGVDYCDLAGLRAIVRLTGSGSGGPGGHSRRVVLHAVPPQLMTVLGILGWDSAVGLVTADPPLASAALAPRSGGPAEADPAGARDPLSLGARQPGCQPAVR